MVTGLSLSSGGSTPTVIGNPMSRSARGGRSSSTSRHHKRVKGQQSLAMILFPLASIALTIVLISLWHTNNGAATTELNHDEPILSMTAARETFEEGLPNLMEKLPKTTSRRRNRQVKNDNNSNNHLESPTNTNDKEERRFLRPAGLDTVIQYLTKLAELPPSELWNVLGMEHLDYGTDPFQLRELESGSCPWKKQSSSASAAAALEEEVVIEWLPPLPENSRTIAEQYRRNIRALREMEQRQSRLRGGGAERQMKFGPYDLEKEVVLWYEHMSKAGGTTFCGLAKSNMVSWQVPKYHCMPRKGNLLDGRVGSWPNDELAQHVKLNKHGVVSNEWDPFDLNKLQLSGRSLGEDDHNNNNSDNPQPAGPKLLFLTTLRESPDRLLSAYTFFALTVKEEMNKKRQKNGKSEDSNNNPPTFRRWIQNNQRRAKNYTPGTKVGFRSNIARFNGIVWRFSGGKLSLNKLSHADAASWRPSFETAVQSLAAHDLVLPMDIMTKDEGKSALSALLGWEKFDVKRRGVKGDKEGGHVVTVGEIRNSKAREYFGKREYGTLWEENWLDGILVAWCKAVFLARLRCGDVLVETS